jgi:hypothetical protein
MAIKIYQAHVSSGHNLIMPHESRVLGIIQSLNFRSLTPDEVDGGFDFTNSSLRALTNPNATILISTLAFRKKCYKVYFS